MDDNEFWNMVYSLSDEELQEFMKELRNSQPERLNPETCQRIKKEIIAQEFQGWVLGKMRNSELSNKR